MSQNDQERKLLKKMKSNPSVPIGLVGLVGVVFYGLYNFKNKKLKTSLYLIHLRVAAQGTLLGCISIGLAYSLCKKSLDRLFPKSEDKNE